MILKYAIAMVAACGALLFEAGTAHADNTDDAFLKVLARQGLSCDAVHATCPDGPSDLIQLGHAICREFTDGTDLDTVGRSILRSTHGNLSRPQVGALMGASISAYCPKYSYPTADTSDF